MTMPPAQTSVSLFARAMRRPVSMASSVGRRPIAPDTAVTTQSAPGQAAAMRSPSSPGGPTVISLPGERLAKLAVRLRLGGGDVFGPEGLDLLQQQLHVPVGGEGRDADAQPLADGGALAAYGAGGAEYDGGFYHFKASFRPKQP